MTQEKYKHFSDDEIYMLSRQTIESSYNIMFNAIYGEQEKVIHSKLMSEIAIERGRRGIQCLKASLNL